MIRFSEHCFTWPFAKVLICFSCCAVATAGPPDPETLRAECLNALTLLETKFDHSRGEGLLTEYRRRGGKPTNTRTWIDYQLSDGHGRVVKSLIEPMAEETASLDLAAMKSHFQPNTQTVHAYNKKYSFLLTQSAAGYSVKRLEPGDKPERQTINAQFGSFLYPATWCSSRPATKLLDPKYYQVDRVTQLGTEVNSPWRLDLSYPLNPNAKANTIQMTAVWLVVAPAEQWVLKEYGTVRTNTTGKEQWTTCGRIEYRAGSASQIEPVKVDIRDYLGSYKFDPVAANSTAELVGSAEFRFANFRFGDSPARDFTLTAFGLPEFGQTVAQATAARSFPWWTVGAAVGFGVLALVLRRLTRRVVPASGQVAA